MIYKEFKLTRQRVLSLSGYDELLQDSARSRMSIALRERIVLPLLTIQQHALIRIQKASEGDALTKKYGKMVVRSLFGNINASRNSV